MNGRAYSPRLQHAMAAAALAFATACKAPEPPQVHLDAGPVTMTAPEAGLAVVRYDRTTGHRCASDSDCWAPQGPGLDRCSNGSSYARTVAGATVQAWPTPVCLLPPAPPGATGNCDPAPPDDPNGLLVHFCDGADDPTAGSPGVCVPADPSRPARGEGTCYPGCTFGADGSAPLGCVGHDSCVFLTFEIAETQAFEVGARGYGFCKGTCQVDADCAELGAGFACQVDTGFCVDRRTPSSKALGDPCTRADGASGACNCRTGASGAGFCTRSCLVGGVPCPDGWVCETGEPSVAAFPGVPQLFPVAAAAPGLAGWCAPSCTPSVDAGPDAAPSGDASSEASDALAGEDATVPGEAGADARAEAGVDDASAGDVAPSDAPPGDAVPPDAPPGDAAPGDAALDDAGVDADADVPEAGPLRAAPGRCPAPWTCVASGLAGPDCQP